MENIKEGGEAGKRYEMDCRDSSKDCTLRISGSYDEVLSTGELHGQKAHGMSGDVREQLKGFIREEGPVAYPPAGGGARETQQRRPDLPA